MSGLSIAGGSSASMFSPLSGTQGSAHAQKLFEKLDSNSDASIDSTELQAFTDFISEKTGSKVDSQALFSKLDGDGNGAISATELTYQTQSLFSQLQSQMFNSMTSSSSGMPDPSEMFSRIDSDGDDSISRAELDSFSSKMGGHGPNVADLIKQIDTDGDGALSASELASAKPPETGAASSTEDGLSRIFAMLLKQYEYVDTNQLTASTSLGVAA